MTATKNVCVCVCVLEKGEKRVINLNPNKKGKEFVRRNNLQTLEIKVILTLERPCVRTLFCFYVITVFITLCRHHKTTEPKWQKTTHRGFDVHSMAGHSTDLCSFIV